ncbi:hypothetical protein [Chenggangzhangella methanolivorans]|uniref:Uncharacterized protein n=2 Tax=Chenggangzhangella methanolivorans TaxID=1437009 RepID=A0A9E6R6Q9_9HYPH|nr:hypothetical protein [Chenggangzhangella methanolivorans]QZN98839.1 hypothetical protein K6K41_18110 [Chenggangzhangella methanolivorans]
MAAGVDPAVEKSIRASFGGGFSVRTQTELRGLTYAEIEHSGNRFVVASADALDWKFVASDRTL